MKKTTYSTRSTDDDDDDDRPSKSQRLTSVTEDKEEYVRVIAERTAEQPYYPQTLTDEQANRVVATLVLAQQMLEDDVRFFLQVGGAIEYPMNQEGEVMRSVSAEIVVHPNVQTLVCKRFTYSDSNEFGLKCQFVIGSDTARGVPASNTRVPFPLQRRDALELPWAAYNSAIHSETDAVDRSRVVFIDKPNVPLNGDAFYLETTDSAAPLNEVGTSPNDEPSDNDTQRRATLHFYDELFASIVASATARNMYNENEALVSSPGTSINIKLSNAELVSAERWKRAVEIVKRHLTTPARIERIVGHTIKYGVAFV